MICNTCGGPLVERTGHRRRDEFCPACFATGGHRDRDATEATKSTTRTSSEANPDKLGLVKSDDVELNRRVQQVEQRLRRAIVGYHTRQVVGERRVGERRGSVQSKMDHPCEPSSRTSIQDGRE
jgi:uncharacterized Zn finger protein (UPF0148 family)